MRKVALTLILMVGVIASVKAQNMGYDTISVIQLNLGTTSELMSEETFNEVVAAKLKECEEKYESDIATAKAALKETKDIEEYIKAENTIRSNRGNSDVEALKNITYTKYYTNWNIEHNVWEAMTNEDIIYKFGNKYGNEKYNDELGKVILERIRSLDDDIAFYKAEIEKIKMPQTFGRTKYREVMKQLLTAQLHKAELNGIVLYSKLKFRDEYGNRIDFTKTDEYRAYSLNSQEVDLIKEKLDKMNPKKDKSFYTYGKNSLHWHYYGNPYYYVRY